MKINDSDNVLSWVLRELTIPRVMVGLFLFSLITIVVINLLTIGNPIIEQHGFRQTHTALTTYYLVKDGFSLNYETPVIGMPWSIPLEYPIYEEIVAIIAKLSGFPLTNIGRMVSLVFALLSCIPIFNILKKLEIDGPARYLSLSMYLSAPTYMFWSGTFMIDNAANFFTLCFLYYSILLLKHEWLLKNIIYCSLFLSLALLQKVLTPAPVLLVVGSVFIFKTVRFGDLKYDKKRIFLIVALVVFSSIIGYSWIKYSDFLKQQNPIALHMLTSQGSFSWNFGNLSQKLSPLFWYDVVYKRNVASSSFEFFGLLAVIFVLLFGKNYNLKKVIAGFVALYLLPFVIFTNVHSIHNYYQVANLAYWSVAVGVAIYYICNSYLQNHKIITSSIALIFLASNYYHFFVEYYPDKFKSIDPLAHRTLVLSDYLKVNTSNDKPIIVYGLDWTSEIAFYSERRALMVPDGDTWLMDTIFNLPKYLPETTPSVFVLCPHPKYEHIKKELLSKHGSVAIDKVVDCEVIYPKY